MRIDDQPSHLTYLSELSFKCSPEKMTLLGRPDRSRAERERRQSYPSRESLSAPESARRFTKEGVDWRKRAWRMT